MSMRAALVLTAAVLFLPAARAAKAPRPDDAATGHPALVAAFEPLLADDALAGARLSLEVAPASGGGAVFGWHAAERLHPASNTKLLTTAAALSRLGPSYVWTTDLAVPSLEAGVAPALYLVGRGDPSFFSESLWKLVDDARLAGLREIQGDLVVDESYFTSEHTPPGFGSKTSDEAFRAPSGAASLNFNQLVIRVDPGLLEGDPVVVRVTPDCGYALIESKARTRTRGKPRLNVQVQPRGERVVVKISGHLTVDGGPFATRRRIVDPALFVGLAARALLGQHGIAVRGQVKKGKAPEGAQVLSRLESRPLSYMTAEVNKFSNNFMAEQLVRTLGAVKRGRGDWGAGRAEVLDFARAEVGLDGIKYANGSGLFGDTALSASDLVRLLVHMHTRRPPLPEYEASLAVGGVDGAMLRRAKGFPPYAIRVKTGTLDGVVALSGFAPFADGTTAAFSFLMNDVKGRAWEVWRLHEQMLGVIGRFNPRDGTLTPEPASP